MIISEQQILKLIYYAYDLQMVLYSAGDKPGSNDVTDLLTEILTQQSTERKDVK